MGVVSEKDAAAGCEAAAERGVDAAWGLVEFVEKCPSMFHTAAQVAARLEAAGFSRLRENEAWGVVAGGKYYVVRNNSSVLAFAVGAEVTACDLRFSLCAAHGDSPALKVKSGCDLHGPGDYARLDVEVYGGPIDHSWLDRPLGVAGRVMVREGSRVVSRLYDSGRDVALIPNVAIHLNREAGRAPELNRAVDLPALFSAGELGKGSFDQMVADDLGVAAGDVLARDLFLYNRTPARVWGAADEFVSGRALDDLGCAYTALEAFLGAENPRSVAVYACFDNEEVGSNTKQGAMSTFLVDTLERLAGCLGATREQYLQAIARSMLVSCDNAHAVHPNHPQKHDEANRCWLNRGLVIKEAANQHYCTDAFSRAALIAVLDDADVPYQTFANRSDMAGGGTLGNLSNMQVSLHGVDVGLPQLAMHSSYETAGARDVALGIDALTAFYNADLQIDGADSVTLG